MNKNQAYWKKTELTIEVNVLQTALNQLKDEGTNKYLEKVQQIAYVEGEISKIKHKLKEKERENQNLKLHYERRINTLQSRMKDPPSASQQEEPANVAPRKLWPIFKLFSQNRQQDQTPKPSTTNQ